MTRQFLFSTVEKVARLMPQRWLSPMALVPGESFSGMLTFSNRRSASNYEGVKVCAGGFFWCLLGVVGKKETAPRRPRTEFVGTISFVVVAIVSPPLNDSAEQLMVSCGAQQFIGSVTMCYRLSRLRTQESMPKFILSSS